MTESSAVTTNQTKSHSEPRADGSVETSEKCKMLGRVYPEVSRWTRHDDPPGLAGRVSTFALRRCASARTQFVNRIHQRDYVIHRCFRKHAVTQIKNMPGVTLGAAKNFTDARFDVLGRCEQRHRIEIALNRDIMTNRFPGVVQVHPPIETDHIAPCSANVFQ